MNSRKGVGQSPVGIVSCALHGPHPPVRRPLHHGGLTHLDGDEGDKDFIKNIN